MLRAIHLTDRQSDMAITGDLTLTKHPDAMFLLSDIILFSFSFYFFFFFFLFLLTVFILVLFLCKHPCVLQHAALSEYRPILADRPQSHSSSMADVKLTLIPIIFIALRIWSTVRFILLLANSPVRWNPVLVTLHVSFRFLFTH